jgi:hypothetical protein
LIFAPRPYWRGGVAVLFSFAVLWAARTDACNLNESDASYQKAIKAFVHGAHDGAEQARICRELLAERGHVDCAWISL